MSTRSRITTRVGLAALVVSAMLLWSPAKSRAQVNDGRWDRSPEQPRASVCGIGRSGRHCASILLLELGMRSGPPAVATLDIGLLVNSGEHEAWGATIGLLGYSQGYEHGGGWVAKGRYRRWLADYIGLDLAAGAGKVGNERYKRIGGVTEVALEFGDVIALTAGLNSYYDADDNHRVAASAGVRLGAYPVLFLARMLGRR